MRAQYRGMADTVVGKWWAKWTRSLVEWAAGGQRLQLSHTNVSATRVPAYAKVRKDSFRPLFPLPPGSSHRFGWRREINHKELSIGAFFCRERVRETGRESGVSRI